MNALRPTRDIGKSTGPLFDHLPTLDGLRGLAVLLVVPHNLRLLSTPHDIWTQLLTATLDRTWVGVQLFFVLSGFLITRILMRTRSATNYYSGFYARRGLRILPLYYGALFLLLVMAPLVGVHLARDPSLNIYLWTFLSNYVQPFHPGAGALPHFWSLAVEEQFYLIWPLLIRHASNSQVLKICVSTAIISLLTRLLLIHSGLPEDAVYVWTPCRMDALALGGLAAVLLEMPASTDWLKQHRNAAWVAALAALGAGFVASKGYTQFGLLPQTAGYSLLAVGFGALILGSAAADTGHIPVRLSWLRWTLMRRMGRYSYGMYVVHVPLGTLVLAPLAERLGWANHPSTLAQYAYVAIGLGMSYAIAALVYQGYERHFLALKHRFEPRIS